MVGPQFPRTESGTGTRRVVTDCDTVEQCTKMLADAYENVFHEFIGKKTECLSVVDPCKKTILRLVPISSGTFAGDYEKE